MLTRILIAVIVVIGGVHAAFDKNLFRNQNRLLDVSHFNCKDKPRISRFPDDRDCTAFIYCISGTAHSAKCHPEGARFNPKTSRCNLPVTEQCGKVVTTITTTMGSLPTVDAPNYLHDKPALSTTTTTAPPPITTTTIKPQKLSDMFSFSYNCGDVHPCGLYPNHEGDCSTFFLCTEDGRQTTKQCHGGHLFDTESQECRPPKEAHCWQEPDSGPYIQMRKPLPEFCPIHKHNSSLPENDADANNDKVLTTPMITNWGNWQNWESCPNGSYISGINAWRRVLQVGPKTDHAGLISIAVQCQTSEGVVTKVIESVSPGAPNDGFGSFYTCIGVAIGFTSNIQPDQGPGRDSLAIDNIQLICSCGPPAYKPYESIPGIQGGYRGQWYGVQSCGPREALCGIQTQLADYKEGVVGQYDNTGLNNVKMKCCPVLNPLENCDPIEKLEPIRSCSNTHGIYPRRCDFQFSVGTAYNYDDPRHLHSINFHQSVGYFLGNKEAEVIKKRFQLAASIINGTNVFKEYPWDQPDNALWTLDNFNWTEKALYLPVNTSVAIFQVVGACGHFIVRTNRFLRVNTDINLAGHETRIYFDV